MDYNSTYYRKKLNGIREQIFDTITKIVKELGGKRVLNVGCKICVRHYQEWNPDHIRYTFFEVDGDGYGRELFIDTVTYSPSGEFNVLLHDSEDMYEPVWALDDFSATDALYLLEELEMVSDYVDETNEPVVSEYDPYYDPENN